MMNMLKENIDCQHDKERARSRPSEKYIASKMRRQMLAKQIDVDRYARNSCTRHFQQRIRKTIFLGAIHQEFANRFEISC